MRLDYGMSNLELIVIILFKLFSEIFTRYSIRTVLPSYYYYCGSIFKTNQILFKFSGLNKVLSRTTVNNYFKIILRVLKETLKKEVYIIPITWTSPMTLDQLCIMVLKHLLLITAGNKANEILLFFKFKLF